MLEEFIKEKRYLDGVSEKTIKYYGFVFNRWNTFVGPKVHKQLGRTLFLANLFDQVQINSANFRLMCYVLVSKQESIHFLAAFAAFNKSYG